MIKKTIALLLAILTLLSSSACSGKTGSPLATSQPSAKLETTATPSPRPTASSEPTASPEPVPAMISLLSDYYTEHESEDAYTVKRPIEKGLIPGEYRITLVYDEVSDANGSADIVGNIGSSDFRVEFQYSDFFGKKVCAPGLIKSVSEATVRQFCSVYKVNRPDEVVRAVLSTYDDVQYTSITFAANYAIVYEPSDIYASVLHFVSVKDFENNFKMGEYSPGTLSDFSQKINQGEKYYFIGTVLDYSSGQYTNAFSTYKCKKVKIQDEDGNIITAVQLPEKVPVSFEEDSLYIFFGSPMFDKNGDLLFYLHCAGK